MFRGKDLAKDRSLKGARLNILRQYACTRKLIPLGLEVASGLQLRPAASDQHV